MTLRDGETARSVGQSPTLHDADAWRAEQMANLSERRVLRLASSADYERERREIERAYNDRRCAVMAASLRPAVR
jgi:hypothetical protein